MAKPIVIASLRGGLNTEDPAFSLPDDQVVLCENMDLGRSTLGGRRRGHSAVTTSGFLDKTVFLHRHLPTSDETAAQLWAVSTSGTSSNWRYKTTAWQAVTTAGSLALDVAQGQYAIRAQSLHGKLFLAYPTASGTDRLHVWDGTSIRVTGLSEPASVPTVANTGSGSYAATPRVYRTRFTQQITGVTVRRSEPTDASAEFTPSGSGTAARVTRVASAPGEGETHWEVEASYGGADFYRIATVVIATTTYDDTADPLTYATTGTLSADIGDYALQHNPKFLSADQDRLLLAGSWEQPALASRVAWTPVFGAPGVGNDERFEDDTDPFLDLDGYDGGELTDFMGPTSGYHYAYKRKRIYKIVRTYARAQAYQAVPLSDTFGAITRSVIKGLDEAGRPCQYFLDPDVGPSRIGANGVERCGEDVQKTWAAVNKDATLVCHGVFYIDEMLVIWDVAEAGQSFPSIRLKLHIREQTPGRLGARRGWATDTGPYMATLSATMFSDNIEANAARNLVLKPFFGTAISGGLLVMGNTGTTDNAVPYQARLRTRPYLPQGLLGFSTLRTATLLAEASQAEVQVSLIRDYGKETREFPVDLRPSESDETHVLKQIDDCAMAELRAVQIELGDSGPAEADWVLDALALIPDDGQTQ